MELKCIWTAPVSHSCAVCPETDIFMIVSAKKMPSSKEAQEALGIPIEHHVFVQDTEGPWCNNGDTLYEVHVMPKCKHEAFMNKIQKDLRRDPKLTEKELVMKCYSSFCGRNAFLNSKFYEVERALEANNKLTAAQEAEETNHPKLMVAWPTMHILPMVINQNPQTGISELLGSNLEEGIWDEIKELTEGSIRENNNEKTLILPTSQVGIRYIEEIQTLFFEIFGKDGKPVLMYHYCSRGDCHLHSFVENKGLREIFEKMNVLAKKEEDQNLPEISFEIMGPLGMPEYSHVTN